MPTQDELEALHREILVDRALNVLFIRRPEMQIRGDFEGNENGYVLGRWLQLQNPPLQITGDNLVLAFDACKKAGTLELRESEDEKTAREAAEQKAEVERKLREQDEAHRAALIAENDRSKPAGRPSHVEMERQKAEAEAAQRAGVEAVKKRIEDIRKQVTEGPPTIYYPERKPKGDVDPRHGKIDWVKTTAERKRLGLITPDSTDDKEKQWYEDNK